MDQAGDVSRTSDKTTLKKVPKKKQKEVAEKIKEALVDRQKLQELIRKLEKMGYKSAADTLEHFSMM